MAKTYRTPYLCHFLQTSSVISGFFAKRNLQLQQSYAFSQSFIVSTEPCILSINRALYSITQPCSQQKEPIYRQIRPIFPNTPCGKYALYLWAPLEHRGFERVFGAVSFAGKYAQYFLQKLRHPRLARNHGLCGKNSHKSEKSQKPEILNSQKFSTVAPAFPIQRL